MKNYRKIAQELIVTIRGHRTQRQLSFNLGYQHNIVSKWENGSQQISWVDFVALCEHCEVGIERHIDDTLTFNGDPRDTVEFLRYLVRGMNRARVAEILNRSTSTLTEWQKGHSVPRLEDILALIDRNKELVHFIDKLGLVTKIPSLYDDELLAREKWQQVLSDVHYFMLREILRFDEYHRAENHDHREIARKLGISESKERAMIEKLEQLQLIARNGKKYEPLETSLLNPGGASPEARVAVYNNKLKYLEYAQEILEERRSEVLRTGEVGSSETLFGHVMFGVSRTTFNRIKERMGIAIREIIDLIESDPDPKDTLMCLSCFVLDLYYSGDDGSFLQRRKANGEK